MNIRTSSLTSAFALALLTLSSVPAARADEAVKTYPAGSAGDILNKDDRDMKNPLGTTGGAIQIKKDCTGAGGKRLKKGQAGYDACLQERLEKEPKPGETGTPQ